jgi:hypothetical protein
LEELLEEELLEEGLRQLVVVLRQEAEEVELTPYDQAQLAWISEEAFFQDLD